MSGRLDDAEALLERLLAREPARAAGRRVSPGANRQLGNFPQAFSHIGLINSAFIIEECRAGAAKAYRREERAPLH